jgi:hypothetical protein
VPSSAIAFAPFSQNSATLRWLSGLGQAQLWQSNPSTLLTDVNVRKVRITPISRSPYFIVLTIAGIPAAFVSRSRTLAGTVSSGVSPCASTPTIATRASAASSALSGDWARVSVCGR